MNLDCKWRKYKVGPRITDVESFTSESWQVASDSAALWWFMAVMWVDKI